MVEGPGLVRGVGVKAGAFREKKTSVCEPCIMGKQTRKPFPKESDSKESTEPLELVHMDVCGPMPVTSKGGVVTESVFARLELQSGKKVKAVQTDRGGEYMNEEMTALLGKRGTVQRTTAGHSPEQNGSAERLNRTLEKRARALVEDAGLGLELWAEAMVTAKYTRNRVPSSVHGKTPWEIFYGAKPNLSHLRVFGARAYIHVPKGNRKKMEPVSEKGVFLGYEPNSKSYRVLRERDGRILTSRDVMVDELGPSAIVELGSDPGKEEGGARGPSRVRPPTRMGVGAIPTGEADTQPGWVYKIKTDALGNLERYKSRLVAKGYLQKQGIDFEEIYALVSKHTTLRALLAVVAERDLELHQLDVKTASLNGELEEEIYMQQPQGYEQGGPNVVCHLKRTLYGLRQAPRPWHTRLKEELGNFEFVASFVDAALFSGVVDGERV
ncbi:protein with ribonuclease H-like, integrase and retrovirus zinc finger-like domains [Klebsormidium nitens]|uniref:Protein with ribonuclease H-like, integrase and retrovirus zinc finger-like domains n=1 Tax=Klebsormidium nitens TaxID=105231 RepID=A0A1Y1IWT9_KLENI|nr:protein with ribonuclease H-like, integrase and retrovirus zinc finger-like domains [Klebsormidium nitens]|eukprot:GAQ93207.1 protein with ribonuclease H-like, integrase and retrovirus zinc finger-like domains [Klebsormidium nitens]